MPIQDEHWMQLALAEARKSVGLASPNPAVGCILVKGDQLISAGHHIYDQRDHAEIVAIKQAGKNAAGSTAYVTLEPCSHHGRTGPCDDALIAAGISRVVAATLDPNPSVRSNGIAKLQTAGIPITIGICQQQARELNDAFAKFIQTKQPFVTLKAALSLDGKLAPPAHARATQSPHWLTGAAARAHVQQLRHAADAILTGIGTVLADDPALTDRSGLPRRRPLLRVILDSQLRLPLHSQLVRTANDDVLAFCAESTPQKAQAALQGHGVLIERVPLDGTGQLDLQHVLHSLGQRNITSVLAEGGSRLNGSLLRQHLTDKLILFYAQTELGDDAIPFAEGIASPYLLHAELQHLTNQHFGEDACIMGYLHDPWLSLAP